MAQSLSVAFIQGWVIAAGLIAVIGAQNALVLRQGLARAHVGPVVAVCVLSDWLLIALGVYGIGSAIQGSSLALQAFRYGGAAFLLAYGLPALRRAWRHNAALVASRDPVRLSAALGTALALTYLNPHVYLDTLVLLGSIGAQQRGAGRAAFTAGAGLASLMWFSALGYGAAAASPRLQRPGTWRVIDAAVAGVMFLIAGQLLLRPV